MSGVSTGQMMSITEEAPSAYKDISKVLSAERDLVRLERELRPVLNHKGT